MMIISDILIPIIHNQLKYKPLNQYLIGVHRQVTDEFDYLFIPSKEMIINCRSSAIEIDLLQRWSRKSRGRIEPVFKNFRLTLSDLLDTFNSLGITNDFTTVGARRSGPSRLRNLNDSPSELIDLLKLWIIDGAQPSLIKDLTNIDRISFFKDTPIEEKQQASSSSSTMTNLYIPELKKYGRATCDNDFRLNDGLKIGYGCLLPVSAIDPDLALDTSIRLPKMSEDKKKADVQRTMAVSETLSNVLSVFMPPELMTIHYSQYNHIPISVFESIKSYFDSTAYHHLVVKKNSNGQSIEDDSSSSTIAAHFKSLQSNNRFPIVIVPRYNATHKLTTPLTALNFDSFIKEKSLGSNDDLEKHEAQQQQPKGPWYLKLPNGVKVKVVEAGSCTLFNASNWEDVIAIFVAEQKFSAQWPLSFHKDNSSRNTELVQFKNWLRNLSDRLLFLYPVYSSIETSGVISPVPGWMGMILDDKNECVQAASHLSELKFTRNTRALDTNVYEEMIKFLVQFMERPYESRKLPKHPHKWTDDDLSNVSVGSGTNDDRTYHRTGGRNSRTSSQSPRGGGGGGGGDRGSYGGNSNRGERSRFDRPPNAFTSSAPSNEPSQQQQQQQQPSHYNSNNSSMTGIDNGGGGIDSNNNMDHSTYHRGSSGDTHHNRDGDNYYNRDRDYSTTNSIMRDNDRSNSRDNKSSTSRRNSSAVASKAPPTGSRFTTAPPLQEASTTSTTTTHQSSKMSRMISSQEETVGSREDVIQPSQQNQHHQHTSTISDRSYPPMESGGKQEKLKDSESSMECD